MKDAIGIWLARWRVREVLPHVHGRLLDIGCGMNRLVDTYPGTGFGVDVHKWEGIDLLLNDSSRLPFDAHTFDTVTIIAALGHIPNREEVLVEVRRVLVDSGTFVMTMLPPFVSAVWHNLRRFSDADQVERGMKEGEVYGLTARETNTLLQRAGFQVVHQHRFMLGANRLVAARKVL